MGRIYAQNIIIGDWLLIPSKLKLAQTRGWIYQEMSFGELDKEATYNLLNEALNIPKEADGESKLCEWAELVKSICELARRRPWPFWYTSAGSTLKESEKSTFTAWIKYDNDLYYHGFRAVAIRLTGSNNKRMLTILQSAPVMVRPHVLQCIESKN